MKFIRNLVDANHIVIEDEDGVKILSIKEKMENRTAIFSLQGELLNEVSFELEDELSAMLTVCDNIKVEMSGLDFIASKGIQILLQVQKETERKNGKLTLSGVSDEIKQIFENNGFSDLFEFEQRGDE